MKPFFHFSVVLEPRAAHRTFPTSRLDLACAPALILCLGEDHAAGDQSSLNFIISYLYNKLLGAGQTCLARSLSDS